MTLRTRLIILHSSFAAFAIGAALITILAVRLHIQDATNQFETLVGEGLQTERLRSDLGALDVSMHKMFSGDLVPDDQFAEYLFSVMTRMRELARYSKDMTSRTPSLRDEVGQLSLELEEELENCLNLIRNGKQAEAKSVYHQKIEGGLLTRLDVGLVHLRNEISATRQQASARLLRRDTEVLVLALLVATSGAGLVITGSLILRRRLVRPIKDLQAATEAFAQGDLDYRVSPSSPDELGELGKALNNMAEGLQTSQQKYRSLFENLRDTVIICDQQGYIVEFHDGDRSFLEVEAEHIQGRAAADVWPRLSFPVGTWVELIKKVLSEIKPLRMSDLPLKASTGNTVFIDASAYAVSYSDTPHVAIIMRDVSDRHELQGMLRKSETMEAAVNLAQGIAHDFKNLLHSATATLSLVLRDTREETTTERCRTALEACRQASGLSRKLGSFAGSDHGHPEKINLSQTINTILSSLDESFHKDIEMEVSCEEILHIYLDRDQLTQVLLNLVYNAREAMPTGGRLNIRGQLVEISNPIYVRSPSPHILLSVQDTGEGMSNEVLEHAFEPLYSTKPRTEFGPRGMGLATVYAIVNMAGGFTKIESKQKAGTTINVYLPAIGGIGFN